MDQTSTWIRALKWMKSLVGSGGLALCVDCFEFTLGFPLWIPCSALDFESSFSFLASALLGRLLLDSSSRRKTTDLLRVFYHESRLKDIQNCI